MVLPPPALRRRPMLCLFCVFVGVLVGWTANALLSSNRILRDPRGRMLCLDCGEVFDPRGVERCPCCGSADVDAWRPEPKEVSHGERDDCARG